MKKLRTPTSIVDKKFRDVRDENFIKLLKEEEKELCDILESVRFLIKKYSERGKGENLGEEKSVCPICKGKGENQVSNVDYDMCTRCNGTGKV